MYYFECQNHAYCNNYVTRPLALCDDCKEAARKLAQSVEYNAKMERLSYVDKNEGLRRHRKGGGR